MTLVRTCIKIFLFRIKHWFKSKSFELFGFSLKCSFSAIPIHFFSFDSSFVIESFANIDSNIYTMLAFLVRFWRLWGLNLFTLNRIESIIYRNIWSSLCLCHLGRLWVNDGSILHHRVCEINHFHLNLLAYSWWRININIFSLMYRLIIHKNVRTIFLIKTILFPTWLQLLLLILWQHL